MKGICALYKVQADLQESHLFPKFIVKHTKKTGSNYLRSIVEPNKRLQDGLKLYLLSFKAEQEFSVREKWFAENIYVPYHKNIFELEYDESLFYFAISFLWRVIVIELKTDKTYKEKWYYNQLLEVEKEWREFLTKGIYPKLYNNVNILLTDRVLENKTELKGVDYYFTRALDATVIDNENKTFMGVYGKFNRFIFWSVIKEFGGEENLNEVKINPIKGKIIVPQKLDYFPINSFLGNRIKGISEFPLPNEKQQERILNEIMKDPDKFWKSDVGQSLYNDNVNLNK